MVAVAALGGLSVVMLQITKDQASQTVKSKVVTDLGQFKTQLQSLMQNPAHCQANFWGRSSGVTAVTTITRCDVTIAAACTSVGGRTTVFNVNSTSWIGNLVTDRIKISAISMEIPSTINRAISNARLILTLKTRPDVGRNGLPPVEKTETIEIGVPVVMNTAGTTVEGCPRTWNTTNTY